MEESLITFEIAKLAKEKGFNNNIIVGNVYDINPTQSLLQKWLREVHDIDVNVLPYNKTKKEYEVCVDLAVTTWSGYKTYEEALEIGLQEGLKLIPEIT